MGRIFLRRLLDASTKVASLHHWIQLSAPMRANLDWWISFVQQWNGKSFFLDHAWTPSPAFQLFTDASQQGYGCYWKGHWLSGSWSPQQQNRPAPPSGTGLQRPLHGQTTHLLSLQGHQVPRGHYSQSETAPDFNLVGISQDTDFPLQHHSHQR